jgi:hypothetical protein
VSTLAELPGRAVDVAKREEPTYRVRFMKEGMG